MTRDLWGALQGADLSLGSGGTSVAHRLDGGELTVILTQVGQLACAATTIRYWPLCLADWDDAEYRQWVTRLPSRLTCLLEPLIFLEYDRESDAGLGRSDPATISGTAERSYYELVVDRSRGAELTRHTCVRGGGRRPEPIVLTSQMLDLLASQFERSLHDAAAD